MDRTTPDGFGDGRLVPFADSLWTATTPISFAGIWFPHVMTIIRLTGGGLLLHSPCRPSTALVDEIAHIGSVVHIVAPNWFHDLYLREYRSLYRNATFWGPPIMRRRPISAVIDCVLEKETRTPWSREMPNFVIPGLLPFDESIFFHRPSRTLIVADLLVNVSAAAGAPSFTRFAYRVSGIEGRPTMFPYMRWFGITARRSLRSAAQQILEWNPERLIVGHGSPIASNAETQLRAALRGLVR